MTEEDDLVVIYYSGHGSFAADTNGDEALRNPGDNLDEYYLPYDTKIPGLFSTAIRDDEFGDWMNSIHSKHVVIFLDSCFSGGATKQVKGVSSEGRKAPSTNSIFNDFSLERRVLLAASEENQESLEAPELEHGVFTYYLLKALKGAGDEDGDGKINAEEAYNYVKLKVKKYAAEHEHIQSPIIQGETKQVVLPEVEEVKEREVTAIEGNKEQAELGDRVFINLGSDEGVQVGDIFEVYRELKSKKVEIEPTKETKGKIEVIDVIAADRSLCKVIEAKYPIEVGDKVRKVWKKENQQ